VRWFKTSKCDYPLKNSIYRNYLTSIGEKHRTALIQFMLTLNFIFGLRLVA